MLLVTAVLGVIVRIGRKALDRPADDGPADSPRADSPRADAIRTGSFDSWPAVPTAPGPHRSGD
jgi:hypothetical protein